MVVKRWIPLLLFVGLLSFSDARAQITNSLVMQPRSMAMGGTGVALADDEYALFNNPAGLAGQDTRRFKLIGVGLGASLDTYTELSTSLNTFKNFNISDLNQLMGKNIALRADMVPIVQLPHFAITYLYDAQFGLTENNLANPTFQVGDMITHGVQAGFGWNLMQGKKSTDELRVGVTGKVLWRKGGFYDVSTSGFLQATSNGSQYLNSLLGNYGMGIVADLGAQYVKHLDKDTSLFSGASVTDVGGTKFSDPHALSIPMNISVGVGAERKLAIGNVKFDFDVRNMSQQTAFVNMTHIGTELSLPLLDFDLGLSQMHATYGVAFDIWILRVSATSYTEEYGISYGQDTVRKYMLQIDFSLPI